MHPAGSFELRVDFSRLCLCLLGNACKASGATEHWEYLLLVKMTHMLVITCPPYAS